MTRIYNRKEHTATRRKLRAESPKAERILWWRLRNKQVDGLKFRRQFGVGEYVIDLYCPAAKLAIEIDGESHSEPTARRADAKRQAYIEAMGIRVLRFTNPHVYETLDEVMQEIWRVAKERLKEFEKNPPSSPLAKGGGTQTLVGRQGRGSAPLLTKEGVGGGCRSAQPLPKPGKNPPSSPLGKGGGP